MRQKSGIEICSGWVDGAQIPLGVQVADANTPSGCDGWGRELRRYILEGQGEGGWLPAAWRIRRGIGRRIQPLLIRCMQSDACNAAVQSASGDQQNNNSGRCMPQVHARCMPGASPAVLTVQST